MNILDLLKNDGFTPKKVSSCKGGEYASACPICGGKDRFRCWPEEPKGGRYWCRQCGGGGDAIQYLIDLKGMTFKDAVNTLGLEMPDRKKPPKKSAWEPKQVDSPSASWQKRAAGFVIWAEGNFFSDISQDALQWLQKERNLSLETIKAFRLGWNPKDLYDDRQRWGLPDELNDKGQLKKVWIPEGLVIPFLDSGHVYRVKVRRTKKDDFPRYIVLPGSSMNTWAIGSSNTFVIVESELDGILISQEAGDLTGIIPLGSAQMRSDKEATERLRQAKKILLALDADNAGAKEAWTWWLEHFSNAFRWPPIGGKDPGEMQVKDIRPWINSGIKHHTNRPEETLIEPANNKDDRTVQAYHVENLNDTFRGRGKDAIKFDSGPEYTISELEQLRGLSAGTQQKIHMIKQIFGASIETNHIN